jgi:hypothetical protein
MSVSPPTPTPVVTVRDAAGSPMANCMVTIHAPKSGVQVDWNKSGADGTVRFERLDTAQRYRLSVEPHSDRRDVLRVAAEDWRPADTVVTLPKTHTMRVHVTDSSSKPAKRVLIYWRSGRDLEGGETDESGVVEIRGLRAGDELEIFAGGEVVTGPDGFRTTAPSERHKATEGDVHIRLR